MRFPTNEQTFHFPIEMGLQTIGHQGSLEYKEEDVKKFKGRTIQNSKFKKSGPQPYNARDNFSNWKDKNSQEGREYQMERNRSRNLDKAPPRIEGTNMIDEMQKVGLNTRNTQDSKTWTQAEESKGQTETNTLLENYQQEKQNRIALQEKQHQTIASYNQKISKLEELYKKKR